MIFTRRAMGAAQAVRTLRGKALAKAPKVWARTRARARARLGFLAGDVRGGEIIEYALILGLIAIAAIATIGLVGVKVLARWQSVNVGL